MIQCKIFSKDGDTEALAAEVNAWLATAPIPYIVKTLQSSTYNVDYRGGYVNVTITIFYKLDYPAAPLRGVQSGG